MMGLSETDGDVPEPLPIGSQRSCLTTDPTMTPMGIPRIAPPKAPRMNASAADFGDPVH
jgi:hypothetical protein